ncbi:MAG TPA: TIM-barrel domain-containing protein [Edaphobacter sp.]|nr:TIM-barrel domain-containing protein [Edaphobacter sp.]
MNRRDLLKTMASGALLAGTATPDTMLAEAAQPYESSWTAVAPGVWKATIGRPETQTPVRARQIGPALEMLHKLPVVNTPPLAVPTGLVGVRGVELQLSLEPDELMYGFGLQMMSFQQRSKKRIVRVNADPRVDSGDSHAPVPFYVTTHGYGVLVDTFRHATFYCGEVHPRPEHAISANAIEVNTPQMTRVRERKRTSRVLVEVPRCSGVDVYLFAGPQLLTAVRRYNLYSGGGVLPPEWGLGFWYRPEMHLNSEQVLALGRDLRASGIPCDVLGLEPGWQTHAYSCTFAWDSSRFPHPKQFIDQAGALGFRINLWEHAFTHPASPIFTPLKPYSGNFAVWDGLVPDFAGEQARRVFGDYHGKALIDLGISGFKLDECDNSDFTEGWSFPDQSRFPSGVDGEQMHAEFGLRYQDAILKQFTQREKPTYNLVRSSGALAAPYPFVLYSDLYDHRQFIRALVNSGFSGLLWCPEVRDAASEEDLIRRLQSVVFSPLAMVNAWYIRNPPWKQIEREKNNAGHLSPGWEQLQARCKEIISWRMQLLPYLHAAFAVYQRDGLPPFRALLMDYPEDPALAKVDDEYLVGDRLLVAPLFAGEAQRTVVLPKGEWQDFWTGTPIAGGRKFTLPATTRNIPVYVKSGSVLPWAEVSQHAESAKSRQLQVRVYGDGRLPWSAPESVGGLRLEWDKTAARGSVEQSGRNNLNFQITEWQQIG